MPRSSWTVRLAPALLLAGCLPVAACVDIDGGAAELSWSLFDRSGDSVSCGEADVDEVRLCWEPFDEVAPTMACADGAQIAFACQEEHGATRFDLATGPTAFWVEPICEDGEPAAPATFDVPAPIVREVIEGRVVNLSSIAIVVNADVGTEEVPRTCAAGDGS
jgi:hypothetical protein